MRGLSWLLWLILPTVVGYGCWYAQSEGLFEVGNPFPEALNKVAPNNAGPLDNPGSTRMPTPTAPLTWGGEDGTSSLDQIWDDRYIEFERPPEECDGKLEFIGRTQNGAGVSADASGFMPFVLYRQSDLAPRPGFIAETVDPIAGFLAPLTENEYYPPLPRTEIVALVLNTEQGGRFELLADWPSWLPEPDKVVIGVWGYRPNYGFDNLRLTAVEECGER